ncbi:MAG TPA: hypothetical protein VIC85_15600 [Ktedonobacterales bacterium]|jgi:hypothetical protein
MENENGSGQSTAGTRARRSGYFGRGLRLYRKGFGDSFHRGTPDDPVVRSRVTSADLIDCLNRSGHPISQTAYSEIESGISLPRNPADFLRSVGRCLRLNDAEVEDLKHRLFYDVLYQRLGDLTDEVFPARPEWKR